MGIKTPTLQTCLDTLDEPSGECLSHLKHFAGDSVPFFIDLVVFVVVLKLGSVVVDDR